MIPSDEHIAQLIIRRVRGEASPDELAELDTWAAQNPSHRAILETFIDPARLEKALRRFWVKSRTWERLQAEINKTAILREPEWQEEKAGEKSRGLLFLRTYKWAIAASILLLITGVSLWQKKQPAAPAPIAKTSGQDIPAPTLTKATIVLASGERVLLDSVARGRIALQGDVLLTKTGAGELVYQGTATKPSSLQYNDLYNPRGSTVVTVTLADGTRVWLNAESSLRYPVSFAGASRGVEVRGEAYFEVAPDPARPFIVTDRHSGVSVRVLGTRFNVNGYMDEPLTKVTLLDGAVTVQTAAQSARLAPGDQASIRTAEKSSGGATSAGSGITVSHGVDVDAVMAWKNGWFQFGEKADIGTIMRQIARWYNVDIEYQGQVNVDFGGSISRQSSVSKVLADLEGTGVVHFRIEGKKIIVMP